MNPRKVIWLKAVISACQSVVRNNLYYSANIEARHGIVLVLTMKFYCIISPNKMAKHCLVNISHYAVHIVDSVA